MRLLFPDYDCQTARFAKLAGLKNGRLLEAAEAAGFKVLITADQNIPRSAELRWKEYFGGDSVRGHKSLTRLGAACASRNYGDWLDHTR